MSTLKKIQGNAGREISLTNTNTYQSIPMFCDKGLHEACFIYTKNLPRDTRILVLGSGGGAFDQRLVDAGFSKITSVDFRPDFFRASGTTFVERDLNNDFNNLGEFDLIIAIELIEHLENTAHFLRNIAQCLTPNGTIVITTPNIESGPVRAGFLVTGRITFFTEVDMQGSGHVSPLLHHIFAFHTKNANLMIAKHIYNRSAWIARFQSNANEFIDSFKKNSIKHLFKAFLILIKSLILLILWPFTCFSEYAGNIHIYVLKKS